MKGYELSTPRAALGLTGLAMAAITMGALVILPAKLDFGFVYPYTLVSEAAAATGSVKVATICTKENP